MKIFRILLALSVCLSAVSCIKDEPRNSECDIVSVSLPDGVLNRAPVISNDKIILYVRNDVSLFSLAPEFELTPGATISPESGTPRSFLIPQEYTVTSEDGEWHKKYVVEVRRNNSVNLNYDFENVREVSALGGSCSYDVFFEVGTSGEERWAWASANAAYALTLQASAPNTFPTYQSPDGVKGKCAVLVTRSTGDFGKRVGKPIAAGNLFMGKFDMTNALKYPLLATNFGTPFTKVPTTFSGFYKFTPGETYCEANEKGELVPVPGKIDQFNLYAVMFESIDGKDFLNGENVLAEDNEQIISTALIPDRGPSEEWKEFTVPFVYRPGKSIDPEKLKAGRYSIAVVMSSSQDGDFFCGAIGSTLMVDELSIVCQDEENN